MKFLGWILFLTMSMAQAQQVVEPAPLSVEDDGARKIVERKEGDPEIKHDDKAEVVVTPPATEIVIPNDEVVNPVEPKGKKKKVQYMKPAPKLKVAAKPKVEKKIEETSEALVVTPVETPVTNPVDGQLKFESSSKVETSREVIGSTPAVVVEEKSEQKIEDSQILIPVTFYETRPSSYIQFAFGYVNSRYEDIYHTLDNGSAQTAFKFVTDLNKNIQTGFGIEVLTDTSSQEIPDNIRSLQYRLFADYHAPLTHLGPVRIDWLGGLSLSVGEYGIKRRYLNLQGEEVSVKIKNGTIIGLIPMGGFRFYLMGAYSVDLTIEYHQYFGNPQRYIGGLSISPRLNFPF